MRTRILIRVGRENVDIVDARSEDLQNWLNELSHPSKDRLIKQLLTLLRGLPET